MVLTDSLSGHYDVIAASEPNRLLACSYSLNLQVMKAGLQRAEV